MCRPFRRWLPPILLALLSLLPSQARGGDLLGLRTSYLEGDRMHLLFGWGISSLISDKGVEADGFDLAWKLGVGFGLTPRLSWDFYYQLASLPLVSPDPLNAGADLASKIFMNSTVTQLRYRYDGWAVNPYAQMGVGLYQMASVSSKTGLDFPLGLILPIGAGLESALYRDTLLIKLDYTYQLLFDEAQNSGVLALLGVNQVALDVQTIMVQVQWNLF